MDFVAEGGIYVSQTHKINCFLFNTSEHLVLSNFGLAYAVRVEINLFPKFVVSRFALQERDLTQSYDKSPYTYRKSKKQRDNTNTPPKYFCGNLGRSVGYDSHPTGVVKPVYGIPTFPPTARQHPLFFLYYSLELECYNRRVSITIVTDCFTNYCCDCLHCIAVFMLVCSQHCLPDSFLTFVWMHLHPVYPQS